MKFSKTSLVLLLIQLALVSSVAAKYLYQRWSCPRVWTRAGIYDPSLPMRGRYLSLHLTVDGCGNTYQTASQLKITQTTPYTVIDSFPARLSVNDNRLVATRIPGESPGIFLPTVIIPKGAPCDALRLGPPVNFYISEHAAIPAPIQPNQELWIEVTVPPKGLPRPIQLALKDGGLWKPLAYQ
jgi:hypothetical protein